MATLPPSRSWPLQKDLCGLQSPASRLDQRLCCSATRHTTGQSYLRSGSWAQVNLAAGCMHAMHARYCARAERRDGEQGVVLEGKDLSRALHATPQYGIRLPALWAGSLTQALRAGSWLATRHWPRLLLLVLLLAGIIAASQLLVRGPPPSASAYNFWTSSSLRASLSTEASCFLQDIALLERLVSFLEEDLWRGGLIFVIFTASVHVLLFPSAVLSLTAGVLPSLIAA